MTRIAAILALFLAASADAQTTRPAAWVAAVTGTAERRPAGGDWTSTTVLAPLFEGDEVRVSPGAGPKAFVRVAYPGGGEVLVQAGETPHRVEPVKRSSPTWKARFEALLDSLKSVPTDVPLGVRGNDEVPFGERSRLLPTGTPVPLSWIREAGGPLYRVSVLDIADKVVWVASTRDPWAQVPRNHMKPAGSYRWEVRTRPDGQPIAWGRLDLAPRKVATELRGALGAITNTPTRTATPDRQALAAIALASEGFLVDARILLDDAERRWPEEPALQRARALVANLAEQAASRTRQFPR